MNYHQWLNLFNNKENGENPMLEMIMKYFSGVKFSKLSGLFATLSPVLQHLEENYANDKDARNAVIDTMISILQSHKDK